MRIFVQLPTTAPQDSVALHNSSIDNDPATICARSYLGFPIARESDGRVIDIATILNSRDTAFNIERIPNLIERIIPHRVSASLPLNYGTKNRVDSPYVTWFCNLQYMTLLDLIHKWAMTAPINPPNIAVMTHVMTSMCTFIDHREPLFVNIEYLCLSKFDIPRDEKVCYTWTGKTYRPRLLSPETTTPTTTTTESVSSSTDNPMVIPRVYSKVSWPHLHVSSGFLQWFGDDAFVSRATSLVPIHSSMTCQQWMIQVLENSRTNTEYVGIISTLTYPIILSAISSQSLCPWACPIYTGSTVSLTYSKLIPDPILNVFSTWMDTILLYIPLIPSYRPRANAWLQFMWNSPANRRSPIPEVPDAYLTRLMVALFYNTVASYPYPLRNIIPNITKQISALPGTKNGRDWILSVAVAWMKTIDQLGLTFRKSQVYIRTSLTHTYYADFSALSKLIQDPRWWNNYETISTLFPCAPQQMDYTVTQPFHAILLIPIYILRESPFKQCVSFMILAFLNAQSIFKSNDAVIRHVASFVNMVPFDRAIIESFKSVFNIVSFPDSRWYWPLEASDKSVSFHILQSNFNSESNMKNWGKLYESRYEGSFAGSGDSDVSMMDRILHVLSSSGLNDKLDANYSIPFIPPLPDTAFSTGGMHMSPTIYSQSNHFLVHYYTSFQEQEVQFASKFPIYHRWKDDQRILYAEMLINGGNEDRLRLIEEEYTKPLQQLVMDFPVTAVHEEKLRFRKQEYEKTLQELVTEFPVKVVHRRTFGLSIPSERNCQDVVKLRSVSPRSLDQAAILFCHVLTCRFHDGLNPILDPSRLIQRIQSIGDYISSIIGHRFTAVEQMMMIIETTYFMYNESWDFGTEFKRSSDVQRASRFEKAKVVPIPAATTTTATSTSSIKTAPVMPKTETKWTAMGYSDVANDNFLLLLKRVMGVDHILTREAYKIALVNGILGQGRDTTRTASSFLNFLVQLASSRTVTEVLHLAIRIYIQGNPIPIYDNGRFLSASSSAITSSSSSVSSSSSSASTSGKTATDTTTISLFSPLMTFLAVPVSSPSSSSLSPSSLSISSSSSSSSSSYSNENATWYIKFVNNRPWEDRAGAPSVSVTTVSS